MATELSREQKLKIVMDFKSMTGCSTVRESLQALEMADYDMNRAAVALRQIHADMRNGKTRNIYRDPNSTSIREEDLD